MVQNDLLARIVAINSIIYSQRIEFLIKLDLPYSVNLS